VEKFNLPKKSGFMLEVILIFCSLMVFLMGCQNPALERPEPPPQSPHFPLWQSEEHYLILAYGDNKVIDFSKGIKRLDDKLEELIKSYPAKLVGEKLVNKKETRDGNKIISYWPYVTKEYALPYGGENLDKLAKELEQKAQEVGGKVFKKEKSGSGQDEQIVLEFGLHSRILEEWFSFTGQKIVLTYWKEGSQTIPVSPGKIALVIDDLGSGVAGTEEIFSLNIPLTVAILPLRPFSKQEAERAKAVGYQVILHHPMEPVSRDQNPGAGVVTDLMEDEEIIRIVQENLRSIPHAVWINNHMGSKGTADERVVGAVLRAAKEEGVFFLDSRTTAQSVVPAVAGRLKVPSNTNKVFLDNEKKVDYIKGQLEKLVKIAQKNGEAIGIGHVHPATAEAISQMIPEFEAKGITLVYVQELMK